MIIWMTKEQAEAYRNADSSCPLCDAGVPIREVMISDRDIQVLRNIGIEVRNTDKGIAMEQELRRIADNLESNL